MISPPLPGISTLKTRSTWVARPGGGEVVRYLARHGESRVSKAVLISAVPPLMVKTDSNPGGFSEGCF
jgi:pimeloyl-ACP methyl ester carboxylesterase